MCLHVPFSLDHLICIPSSLFRAPCSASTNSHAHIFFGKLSLTVQRSIRRLSMPRHCILVRPLQLHAREEETWPCTVCPHSRQNGGDTCMHGASWNASAAHLAQPSSSVGLGHLLYGLDARPPTASAGRSLLILLFSSCSGAKSTIL